MSPAPDLTGRVALVTGSTDGNGLAIATALRRRGATVVGAARHPGGPDDLPVDVTVAADRAALVDEVVRRHGRLDVLVNNAGIGAVGFLTDLTAEQLDQLWATNVAAVADLSRLAIPHLRAHGRGDLVMISSVAAWASVPPLTTYCASKFAVDGLVEGLRRELFRSPVRVHSVNPGPISTGWLSRAQGRTPRADAPHSPGFSPDRVADAVLLALSSRGPRTVAVPRWMGIARAAQVPPVGLALDWTLGLTGRAVTDVAQRMVAKRSQ